MGNDVPSLLQGNVKEFIRIMSYETQLSELH